MQWLFLVIGVCFVGYLSFLLMKLLRLQKIKSRSTAKQLTRKKRSSYKNTGTSRSKR